MEKEFNPFGKEKIIPEEERTFSQEQTLQDLEKFNLGETIMVVNGVRVNVQGLAKLIYEQQGVELDEKQQEEVTKAFAYMKDLPDGEPSSWKAWEIKQELLKYKLNNDVCNTLVKAIQSAHPQKGDHVVEFVAPLPEADVSQKTESIDMGREAMMNKLLDDPKLLHVVSGTYRGVGVYRIFSGGKDISVSSPHSNEINLKVKDLQGLPSEVEQKLFGDKPMFDAQPVIMEFEQGTGYGIAYRKPDSLGRSGYGSFWTIVPATETETAEYLKHNPQILINIFKEKLNMSAYSDRILEESNGSLHLADDTFIDIGKN